MDRLKYMPKKVNWLAVKQLEIENFVSVVRQINNYTNKFCSAVAQSVVASAC